MLLPWLTFLATAVVIVIAGTKLSQYGDQIAEKTGLGGLWIGVVLMAAATSMPEVFTTVSASLLDAPDLAVGDLLGAGLTNMLTLGIIDMVYRRKGVWQQAAFGHTLVAALAMVLTALAGFFILLRPEITRLNVGADTLTILILYMLGIRVVFRQEDVERRQREHEKVTEAVATEPEAGRADREGLRRSAIGFALAAVGILAAAPFLAWSGERIAVLTGISTTFVGTFLVAITTSMPELVTAFAAVRLGAFDLAVGNLFGSNAFNMAALFFADVAYREGSLLGGVSTAHALTALWAILLMNLGLMGIIYRAAKRYVLIEPDSYLMILGYVLGMWLLFR